MNVPFSFRFNRGFLPSLIARFSKESPYVLVFFVLLSAFLPKAEAYFSTIDTGDILAKGNYRLSFEAQEKFGDFGGANFVGRFDAGLNESSNIRVLLGSGVVNLQWGLFYKWVPIPDYQDQPAVGIMAGVLYGYQDANFLSFRLHPLVSKKFKLEMGDMIPYAALPIGTTSSNGVTTYPLQFALGAEWKPKNLEKIGILLEAGLNISNAYHYVSVAGVMHFDEENGIQFK